eukprot:COSAG04_NODE_11139_length_728_cov_1.030207_1_plen_43_part_01
MWGFVTPMATNHVSNCPKFRLKWPNFIYKSSKIVSKFSEKLTS